jgi:excisionase family DNA binding protein
MTQHELLNRKEAAKYLGLKTNTLARWAMLSLHLPVVKVGRSVRYKLADLEALVERHTIAPIDTHSEGEKRWKAEVEELVRESQ